MSRFLTFILIIPSFLTVCAQKPDDYPLNGYPIKNFEYLLKNKNVKEINVSWCDNNDSMCISPLIYNKWFYNKNGQLKHEWVYIGEEEGIMSADIFYKYKKSNLIRMTSKYKNIANNYYYYDSKGNLIKEISKGDTYTEFTDFIYENGILTQKIYSDSNYQYTDRSGIELFKYNNDSLIGNIWGEQKITYTYDSLGRLMVEKVLSNENPNWVWRKTVYSYNAQRLISKTDYCSMGGPEIELKFHESLLYFYDSDELLSRVCHIYYKDGIKYFWFETYKYKYY